MQLDSTSINLCAYPARIWQPKKYPLVLRKVKNRGSNVVSDPTDISVAMTDGLQTIYGAIDTHDQTVYHMVCDTVSEAMTDKAQTNRANVMEFLRRIKGRLAGTTSNWVGQEAMELRRRQQPSQG